MSFRAKVMTELKTIGRWAIAPFKYLFKFALLLAFIAYLGMGVQAGWTLYKRAQVTQQDFSALLPLAKKALDAGKPEDVTAWVRFRPQSETDKIIETLTPESARLEPGIFFDFSARRLAQEKTEEALFWMQLGRFRLRYDVLRCGGGEKRQLFDALMSLAAVGEINTLLQENPALVKSSVKKTLDFDNKYPARNTPEKICGVVQKLDTSTRPVAEKDWETIRKNLHAATEAFLNAPEKKQGGK